MSEKAGFIVIEGLDGSGKGTQTAMLMRALSERGIAAHLTAEPTQYSTGGLIRDALAGLTKRSPAELAALFTADRAAHCQNPKDGIAALLERGINVISDRYYYSTFAYQGVDTDLKWLMASNLDCPAILKPNLCVFLDVDPDEADRRIAAGRASREIYESPEAIRRTRKKYFEIFGILSPEHSIKIIDAVRSPEEVFKDLLEAVLGAVK